MIRRVMLPGPRHLLTLVLALSSSLLVVAPAFGKIEASSRYTLPQTYRSALRMLRVDMNCEVVERDPDAAYLLFRYRVPGDPKREVEGAIELIAQKERVKILIKIPKLAELHERMLRDNLLQKLLEDYGEPTPPTAPPKPPEPKSPRAEPAPTAPKG